MRSQLSDLESLHPTLGGPHSTVSQIFYEYKLLKDEDVQVMISQRGYLSVDEQTMHTLSECLHVYRYSCKGNPAYTLR